MALDFRNVNSLWASVAVETLVRLGLQAAIVCPGSRSTPLTYALAKHPKIETLPILDERSAAFFALGCAKRQFRPVVLVCTSGTAGANFYPAVIEAFESGVPLLVLTADRPPEMRDCASGQTIDQQKLFGGFVKHYAEMAVPSASLEMLDYLRQTLVSGWGWAIAPKAGPIHFNCPFRDPLPPLPDGKTELLEKTFDADLFFSAVEAPAASLLQTQSIPWKRWTQCEKGLIIAGPVMSAAAQNYCRAVGELSRSLGWPVLAEGLSPLRNYHRFNNSLVSTYDIILRDADRANLLIPEIVLQLGPLPISKVLRAWLQQHRPLRWVVDSGQNLDPLHGPTRFLAASAEQLAANFGDGEPIAERVSYRQKWLDCDRAMRQALDSRLLSETALVESKVVWLLSQHLPKNTPLFVANSMPVRDVEYFWSPNNRQISPAFSRGANGIDGTLSTAMGVAHRNRPTVLLTGDLAFLHDTNGLLNARQMKGHLTVVVINNRGGGIFEMLPISQFEPEFEKYFVTPQSVDLSSLCKAYDVAHRRITEVKTFVDRVKTLPAEQGIRVLEVVCSRQQSVLQRKALLNSL